MIWIETEQDCIEAIKGLYPPESDYADTQEIGQQLMDENVETHLPYEDWQELPASDLANLARANLEKEGEPYVFCESLQKYLN